MNFVAGHDPVTELNGCKECKSEDGQEEPELEMVNWDQLERDVFTSRKRDNSRFKPCLNLREEIRRQLAEDDAKKNHAQEGKLRKSKSGFLDETSSSDSDNDEMVDVILTDVSTTTSAEDFDDDKEFYLNSEFSTKIMLQKAPNGSTFRGSSGSNSRLNSDLSSSPSNSRDLEHLEVRPIQSRPNLKTRIQNLKDLQICFLNDLPVRPSDSPSSGRSSADSAHRTADYLVKMPEGPSVLSQDFWSPPADAFTKSPVNHQLMPKSHSMFEIETEKQKWNKMVISQFEETEARWKQEMQVRIQHAHQSIHLQMQRQRRRHKRTPVSTKVALPHGKTRLDRAFLSDMNITHLQIILNDIHGQIKALNEELVDLLEQRDELHMEQDSTLVDIDDLSRRLRELWMVTFRRKTLPPKDLPDPLNGSTAAFVRKIEDSSGFPNGISDPSVNGNQYSSAQAPSTPTTLSGSLQIFRQRIRSLLQ